jgi:hypothetical protein
MKRLFTGFVMATVMVSASLAEAATCTPTGFFRDAINMTAALINPPGTVSGTVDATGCNIAIYYDSTGAGGTVKNADVFGANYFGILVNGDAGSVDVDVINSNIHDIGETPHNGAQHGVAVYYRGFFDSSSVTGKIWGNSITAYQKGGVVVNGQGLQVSVHDNTVVGDGHVVFIAQNGIQVGYGATASVMRNVVSGNSYIGFPGDGSASGGVLVVGGPGYGVCPDGNDCPYTVNTKIDANILANNDVGVYLSNVAADFSAPTSATNIKAINNTLTNDVCFNTSYVAAISDQGNNDKLINNKISNYSCPTVFNPLGNPIDADTSFTNRPKVHANK